MPETRNVYLQSRLAVTNGMATSTELVSWPQNLLMRSKAIR
jgi:hypothetical protein